MQFNCVVNSVGPTSGHFEQQFLDPRDDPDTHGPAIVLTLTDMNETFVSFGFLVDTAVSNTVLAVALAAVSTRNHVMADVDWPQPVIGQDQDGNDIYGPAICYSLWLTAG